MDDLHWIEVDPDRHVSDCDRYDVVETAYYWEDGTVAWSPRRLIPAEDEVVHLTTEGQDCPRPISMTLSRAKAACNLHAKRAAELGCTCRGGFVDPDQTAPCPVHDSDVAPGHVRVVTDGATVHLTAGEGVDLRDVLRGKGSDS